MHKSKKQIRECLLYEYQLSNKAVIVIWNMCVAKDRSKNEQKNKRVDCSQQLVNLRRNFDWLNNLIGLEIRSGGCMLILIENFSG